MAAKDFLIDLSKIDFSRPLATLDDIRAVNPQRFEMEQLTAIVHLDHDAQLLIGYKDVRGDEFWARGHVPGCPLMPGVLICEAAAQLCGFYCHAVDLVPHGFLGFGGIDDVRFRGPVRPGDRLVIIGKAERLRRRQPIFDTQAFVEGNMVFHGKIIGVPLTVSTADPDQTIGESQFK